VSGERESLFECIERWDLRTVAKGKIIHEEKNWRMRKKAVRQKIREILNEGTEHSRE